ncbi:asparaginyl-tRNA synthetase-like [Tubulanus polymorphus]|uniref:asparaginyl-tRNA synthetase-like n=1 Tax=Tubulanus polymorphus TaxID=672921 RepID=UPI003DA3A059
MGWVKAIRHHKDLTFIQLSDGSCSSDLQIVSRKSLVPSEVTFGCSISAEGCLVLSKHARQEVEMKAEKVSIIGMCNSLDYPLKPRTRHNLDYYRQFIHLRPRSNTFSALLRIRSSASQAIHRYFRDHNFMEIHAPLITSNDCEGAGETFHVQSSDDIHSKNGLNSSNFFDCPVFLSVSKQLHLEVMASAFSKVYTFGPTFRADNSVTRQHLAEFYMAEAEISFLSSLADLMVEMENLMKYVTEQMFLHNADDLNHFYQNISPENYEEKVKRWMTKIFVRLTYNEAFEIMRKNADKFESDVQYGNDFTKEQERFLVSHCGDVPVFIHDFPCHLKPFYCKRTANEIVEAVDLLTPLVGELFGGSLREDNYNVLKERLVEEDQLNSLGWYLELRKFGSTPHGGFGMGFERYLQTLLGVSNIKDVIPFPRARNHCKM